MRTNLRLIVSVFILLAFSVLSVAQDKKTVSGYITNKSDNDKPISDVIIYAYNTVAEAQDAYDALIAARRDNSFFSPGIVTETYPDIGGYYEILVPSTGALLFYTGIADPVMEKVNYRLEINVSFSLNILLESSKVTAGSLENMQRMIPVQRGPNTVFPVKYNIPAQELGKPYARLVKQSYLINEVGNKTNVTPFTPVVYDGKEYHLTQLRRMNYTGENDPLYLQAESNVPLSDELTSIEWTDTVPASYSEGRNYLKWKLWVENYQRVVYADSGQFRTDRISRPMEFLEFPVEGYNLDLERFRKNPRRERRDVADKISLNFLVGQAKIDPADTMSRNNLDKLEQRLRAIVMDADATLKEFHITGIASPDGKYDKNLDLAKRRLNYALDVVRSILPKSVSDRVYMTRDASVASWDAVADLLQKDSLLHEAGEIREIIAKNPNQHDRQGYFIRRLPYYKDMIVPRLPALRTIKYTYMTEIYRELSRDEIYALYIRDRSKNLEPEYALYEYWHLFNMVNDDAELERLCRQACKVSAKTESRPWALPANMLASYAIKRGEADTTLIASYIDPRFPCNYTIRDMNRRTEEIVNPAELVANMVTMCLMKKEYARAFELASMLPDSFDVLKAAAWCLAGNFDDNSDKGRAYYVLMRDYSPRNKVIMNLANGNIGLAKAALRELPQDDPITKYLSVRIMCHGISNASSSMDIDTYDNTLADLLYCFKADPKFIDIAEREFTICEDLYKDAKRQYDNPIE